jgi:acyl-CoA synthetase (AMP-forming)/AMP-acid ligase II
MLMFNNLSTRKFSLKFNLFARKYQQMDVLSVFSSVAVGIILFGFVLWTILPSTYKKMISASFDLVYVLIQIKIHSLKHHGKRFSYADIFEETVDKHPSRIQFISVEDSKEYLLSEMEVTANQIAWWLRSNNVSQKDKVAMMMLNRPEFVIFWLGCAKVGVTCSLINTNSTGKTFQHAVNLSIENSNSKIVVIDGELKDQVANEVKELESVGVKVFYWNNDFVAKMIKTQSPKRPSIDYRSKVTERDPLMLIFTSGTTGLPKASNISHSRFIVGSWPYVVLAKLTPNDNIYNTMPLYHSAAGMLGVGTAFRSGACMVLRKKFSVKSFAGDCVKFKCTSMQYIGELCRYLLSAPPTEEEENISLRTAFGNGKSSITLYEVIGHHNNCMSTYTYRNATRRMEAVPRSLQYQTHHRILCKHGRKSRFIQ